jgi:glycerol-3-phosphate dehydrogenase (NAD(P)+)
MDEQGVRARRRITVIGAGSWGTALSMVAARNHHDVMLWAREPQVVEGILHTGRNPFYLTEFVLSRNITPTGSIEQALEGAEIVLIVVPSHAMRRLLEKLRGLLSDNAIIVSATKGVENGTQLRMSEVIRDVLGPAVSSRVVALSGPSFSYEVAKEDPTAVVAAGRDSRAMELIQKELSSNSFRVYTNDDVVGVELGGAVKNIVAIASGVVRGLGFGTNSVAAIITRGLAEITRLALVQGARAETMAGLAGLGDLVLTCTGELSRNRRVGVELGKGRRLSAVLSEMREVAEGVKTTQAVYEMSLRLNVEMPITSSVYALLYRDKPALEAADELMGRPLRAE